MKKIISLILVAVMAFSMTLVASAEETTGTDSLPVIPYVQNAPTVDGEKDAIYDHALVVDLNTVVDFPIGKPGTIPAGFSVKMSLVYDESEYLYAYVEIVDPTPVSTNKAVATDDSFRFFWYNDLANVPASIVWWGTTSADNNYFDTLYVESTVKTTDDPNKWFIEFCMPIYRFDKPAFDLGCMAGEEALPAVQLAPHYFNCVEGAGCTVTVSNGLTNLKDVRGTDSYDPRAEVPMYLLSQTMIDNEGNPVAADTTSEEPATTPEDTTEAPKDTNKPADTADKGDDKPADTKADDGDAKDGGSMLWIIAVVAGVVVVAIVVVLVATKKKKK